MARPEQRRPENVAGDFYVDDTCIDCDTCRWIAPEVFARAGGQSAVSSQPVTAEQRRDALRAMAACPTFSIGTERPDPGFAAVRAAFPLPVDADGEVLYCGYHSEKSFGAASYLIPRAEGNVLVDSPRAAAPLLRRMESLGGVAEMFLTHGDDVADHALLRQRFGCARLIHEGDRGSLPEAERLFTGLDPIALAEDLLVIPVPGHTRGSCCLLYRGKYLFTGDHLAYSVRLGHLYAFRDACWHSWKAQIESMEKLLDYSFEWMLPGHGRRLHLPAPEMRASLERCVAWMKGK